MLEPFRKGFYRLRTSRRSRSVERVATGFRFTEGPVWFADGGYLLFSDIAADRILKLTSEGTVTVFREPSGGANGLTRDRRGRLLACEQGHRRVSRTEEDGSVTVCADHFQGKRLNSPNDVVVRSDGSIYFTDPPYGIRPEEQELPVQGVYRLAPGGEGLTLLVGDFVKPNGLAFSPDERRLYVDDSGRRHIRVFEVLPDGRLTGGGIFYDMDVTARGSPDGMKVDAEGHLYCTGPGGVWIFDSGGRCLEILRIPEKPSNCAWGDEDWKSLYVTARSSVYRVRRTCPGIPVRSGVES
jgi:gluconolactonase